MQAPQVTLHSAALAALGAGLSAGGFGDEGHYLRRPKRSKASKMLTQARYRSTSRARTPSFDEIAGPIVKAGLGRIERKKGQPPKLILFKGA